MPAPPRPRPWSPSSGAAFRAAARAARRRRSRRPASPSHVRSAAPSAAGSPGATSIPGRVPSSPWPSASLTPPTSAASTGTPRASASVRTMPYVSAREASTSRSAAAYASSSSAPMRAPGKCTRPSNRRARRSTPLGVVRVADEAAHALAAPRQVLRRGERVEQHVVALVRRHRGHAEERAPVRASPRERGGLHAGLGHVDAVGRQSVQLAEPPPRPGAGRDDGGGRREDRPLAFAHRAGVAIRRPVAERHVHEHDLPQPARLRHEDLGRGRRDQAVEQDHGAVRDPADGARQRGRPRRPRPRPVAGDRVLVHRPAERGEPAAQPAVVDVAAARLRRIVDPLGDDDVDLGHSDRS